MDKTPKDHVLDALRTGDGKQITAYLNKYYKDVVGYYRTKNKNEGAGGQVEEQGAKEPLGRDRQNDRPTDMDGIEAEANTIFGE